MIEELSAASVSDEELDLAWETLSWIKGSSTSALSSSVSGPSSGHLVAAVSVAVLSSSAVAGSPTAGR